MKKLGHTLAKFYKNESKNFRGKKVIIPNQKIK